MPLGPTTTQRRQLQQTSAGRLSLVRFLSVANRELLPDYLAAAAKAVTAAGGQRTHAVRVDQGFAGGALTHTLITVDRLRSGAAVLAALDAVERERHAALADVYALLVKPLVGPPQIARRLGFLAPLLSRILGTTRERELTGLAERANPLTGPVPETVAAMRRHDQATPFFMMNLNRYFDRARYPDRSTLTGEQAYWRYSSRILPYLVSVRGYPDLFGEVLGTVIGDERSLLHDTWSDFALVFYPSRRHFLRMMTHTPPGAIIHRNAGLQRAILMPCTGSATRP